MTDRNPLDYETPKPRRRQWTTRDVFGRIVLGAWAAFGAANLLGFLFIVDDRSSLQWPAAILAGCLTIGAVGLTAFHWLVLVPALWFRHGSAGRSRPTK